MYSIYKSFYFRTWMKLAFKKFYKVYLFLFARPSLQTFNELLLRVLLGALGYMNPPEDFILSGERKLIKRLQKFDLKIVVDIGANKGQWSSMILKETRALVYAFEPQSIPYIHLEHLSKSSEGRLIATRMALGRKLERAFINVHQSSDELSFIGNDVANMPLLEDSIFYSEPIQITTLDLFVKRNAIRNIDFIKIDTEGFEFDVLIGASKTIATFSPKFIQIEMNWHQLFMGHSIYSISRLLSNYELYQILPFGKILLKVDARSPIRNFYQLSNFLFVKKQLNIF